MKKRKDCGGDTSNTSTVTETTKKRAYKRKDRGGDTIGTPTTVVKKRKDCGGDTTSTTTVMEIKKKRPYRRKKSLPHDLIFEEILTKLPVPTLL
ncbi:hypothetical protein MKW94_006867, partial [Papaver nudicaule]|nr:hypothetical protein [Papaver nudicaule]